jgi:hypothetical protein
MWYMFENPEGFPFFNNYYERVKVEWSYIKSKSELRTVEEYTQKKIYYKNKHVKYALFQ